MTNFMVINKVCLESNKGTFKMKFCNHHERMRFHKL